MDKIINTLSKVSIFEGIPLSVLHELSKRAHPNMHKKGKVLFIHGDIAEHYYVVESGHVKLFRETLDGMQAVIDILSQGDVFGHCVLLEGNTYPYSAEIVESGTVISLPLSDLREEIHSNNEMAVSMLRAITRQQLRKERELEHRSTQSATQRIGCFILRQILKEKTDSPLLHLPYDKMLIAARLGMQPETFSRALSRLKKKTGLRIDGSTIYLDTLSQLSSYTCPSCSGKFPCEDLLCETGTPAHNHPAHKKTKTT